jgi:hypothetical protein
MGCARGEFVRSDDDGENFKADFAGEISRAGGSCKVGSTTGNAEK